MKLALLAISAAFIGAGNGLQAFANGEEAPESAAPTPAPAGDGAEPRKRGRPPGAAAAKPPEGATAGNTTAEDDTARFESNRALIKQLVDAGQGEDVKKVIAKYSKTGLKDLPADKQADFEKDIAALSY